ncbi:hypothetical protein JCM5350_002761 [Sporobolomyces pararoseus]
MSTKHPGFSKIDHLSLLPPELLSDIFDLADDPEHPLSEPLSRSLLPYFRQNLYRQIEISSTSSLSNLLETVRSHPSLGILVASLDISQVSEEGRDYQQLKDLLRHLSSLRSLSVREILPFPPDNDDFPQLTLNLESISLTCTDLFPTEIDILSRIKTLKSVAICSEAFLDHSGSVPLGSLSGPCTQVEKLSMTHIWESDNFDALWTKDLARFVDKFFPRITHLCLRDDNYPNYRTFLSALETVSRSIDSLVLQSGQQHQNFRVSCQDLLPRFKNLKHLELGEKTVSSPLAVYLRQLPALKTLRLAPRTNLDGLTLADLLSVIDGPSRTTSLRVLVVDSINKMRIGWQVDSDADEASLASLEEDGWSVPRPDLWHLEDLERILEAGLRNGVEVRGTSLEGLKVWRLAKLEESNRLILRVYRSKSFDEYIAVKATLSPNPRLPYLNVDRLDPENLKLVKIDLPEEDWIQFTLE